MRYHRPQASGAASVPLWHDAPRMTQRHSMPLTLVIRIALRALARNLLRSGQYVGDQYRGRGLHL